MGTSEGAAERETTANRREKGRQGRSGNKQMDHPKKKRGQGPKKEGEKRRQDPTDRKGRTERSVNGSSPRAVGLTLFIIPGKSSKMFDN